MDLDWSVLSEDGSKQLVMATILDNWKPQISFAVSLI